MTGGWTAGRIAALGSGVLLALVSLGLLTGGGSAGAAVRASVAISAPFLFEFGIMLLLSGLGLGLLAACLIVVAARLARAG